MNTDLILMIQSQIYLILILFNTWKIKNKKKIVIIYKKSTQVKIKNN